MAIGGVATNMFGTHNVFLIDAFLFLVGIYLFSSIHIKKVKKKFEPFTEMIKNGFLYIKNHHLIFHLMLLHASVALTSIDALINLLTDFHYKYIIAIPLAIGWINATRAFALMVGPFVIGRYVNKKNLHLVMFIQGVIFTVWAMVEHNFYISLISMFAVGFLTTTLWSYTYTMLQEQTEQKFLGRVVAYNDMVFMLVSVSTTMFIGIASKNGISLSTITVMIGLGFIMTGFYYIWFKRKYLESESN